jgi:hypothetical protein
MPSMSAVMKALKKTGHTIVKTIFRFRKNRERTNIIEAAANKKSRLNSPEMIQDDHVPGGNAQCTSFLHLGHGKAGIRGHAAFGHGVKDQVIWL